MPWVVQAFFKNNLFKIHLILLWFDMLGIIHDFAINWRNIEKKNVGRLFRKYIIKNT